MPQAWPEVLPFLGLCNSALTCELLPSLVPCPLSHWVIRDTCVSSRQTSNSGHGRGWEAVLKRDSNSERVLPCGCAEPPAQCKQGPLTMAAPTSPCRSSGVSTPEARAEPRSAGELD